MTELDKLDSLRKIPPASPKTSIAALAFSKSLSSEQRALLAAVIAEQEDEIFDTLIVLRECLIPAEAHNCQDLRQSLNAISRWSDGKLYDKHTQGPDEPIEEIPEDLATLFPHVARAARKQ